MPDGEGRDEHEQRRVGEAAERDQGAPVGVGDVEVDADEGREQHEREQHAEADEARDAQGGVVLDRGGHGAEQDEGEEADEERVLRVVEEVDHGDAREDERRYAEQLVAQRRVARAVGRAQLHAPRHPDVRGVSSEEEGGRREDRECEDGRDRREVPQDGARRATKELCDEGEADHAREGPLVRGQAQADVHAEHEEDGEEAGRKDEEPLRV